ncbi:hypothetical protein CDEST_01861 [Colletotrichum destructivum]|uniref:Uncharacterized protein n=1 Tax=Colletotrichum destructivum TaxID=34406 RepID=A0AAX4I151_9PEZI|nr:hypothetical protein CDEST_01861 [Colletotrichum destructivum]
MSDSGDPAEGIQVRGSSRSDTPSEPKSRKFQVPIPRKFTGLLEEDSWGDWINFELGMTNSPVYNSTYIVFLAESYQDRGLYGRRLFDEFQNDFEGWNADYFDNTIKNAAQWMRDTLYWHGIFFPMDNTLISTALAQLVTQEEFHVWTEGEIKKAKTRPQFKKNYNSIPDFAEDITYEPESIEDIRAEIEAIRASSRRIGTPARNPLPIHVVGDSLTARQLTDLTKLYSDDFKYGGEKYEVFERRLMIFRDKCSKVGIAQSQWNGALDIMLRGRALQYYYDYLCDPTKPMDFHSRGVAIQARFETHETQQLYLSEWRTTTLPRILQENPGKNRLEALEILIERLVRIHQALPRAQRESPDLLRDQLLNACREVEECQLAIFAPAPTFEGVCGNLRAAVGTALQLKARQFVAEPHDQYWTDRRYNGHGKESRYGRNGPQNRRPSRYGNGSRRNGPSSAPNKRCYVCGKSGCWSNKHSDDERRQAYSRYKNNPDTQDRSSAGYHQYLAWYEGYEEYEPANSNNHNDQYHQDADTSSSDEEDNEPKEKEHFFTSFFTAGTTINGRTITEILAERSIRHALTGDNEFQNMPHAGEFASSADLYTYLKGLCASFAAEGRYSDRVFHGIMPDTGAAEISSAGQPQFLALQRRLPTVTLDTSTAGSAKIRFGEGRVIASLGSTKIPTPFGPISFHIMPCDTPFLLCLRDMDCFRIKFDNLKNYLQQGNIKVPAQKSSAQQQSNPSTLTLTMLLDNPPRNPPRVRMTIQQSLLTAKKEKHSMKPSLAKTKNPRHLRRADDQVVLARTRSLQNSAEDQVARARIPLCLRNAA